MSTLRLLKALIPKKIFLFFQPAYHFFLAWFAALFYGFPSRHLTTIGVTGTNGKTTVVELVHQILRESGVGVVSVSSLRFKIGDQETRNEKKMTMPGRFFLQKFLHEARQKRCRYAILEVTSEGIKQFRHRFIKFDAAVMTNVAPEHVEAHGGFEKYLRAKLDLFWRLPRDGTAIINRDDPHLPRFSAATAAHKIFYGKKGITANGKTWTARDIKINDRGIEFDINGTTIVSPLLGEFNFYNILTAAAVGLGEHLAPEKIASAISRVSVIPGRMEFVQRRPFAVVVDYAHTPDSLKNVYTFLSESQKSKVKSQKLICVLGSAGGGRDKWKRPEFGKIAAEFCDEIILTNEDPYDENPAEILDQIAQGFRQLPATSYQLPAARKILDRREAIREALKSAKPGDTVIITGKGVESWIAGPGGTKIPWDERKVVREELEKLKK